MFISGIILNIYVVLAASVITVIASIFLKDDANLSYSIIGSLLFLSTTTMISILFLPKVRQLYYYRTVTTITCNHLHLIDLF